MGFAELDKRKKITIIVAGVGLAVGALLIINAGTGGGIKEAIAPTPKPEPPAMETKAKETYVRQREELKEAEETGQASSAGG
ncbi:MAG: hypothetical protein AMXMBFR58_10610 [Phycisphaerae bacterium]|nr:hypothetical protein [Phycisphaerales bacterium]